MRFKRDDGGFEPGPGKGIGKYLVRRQPGDHERWSEYLLPADSEAQTLEVPAGQSSLWWLGGALALILVVLVGRLANLQIQGGGHNFSLAEDNRVRQKITRAPRGVIYDRNHNVLVRNEAGFDVNVIPSQLPRSAATRQAEYAQLGKLTGVSAADIAAKTEAKGVNYPVPLPVIPNLDRDKALLLDQSVLLLTGFSLDVNPSREYAAGLPLSHVLGYTGPVDPNDLQSSDYIPTDYVGKAGLEKQYENVLKGTRGSDETEVDAEGHPVKVLAAKPAQPGQNLVLSIDSELELHLAQSLQTQMDRGASKRGAAVALNPKTGEILASVSLPGYDNNLFSRGISQADFQKLVNDSAGPLYNKVTAGAYPSGSIIKPLVASAALDEHVIDTSTTIVDKGKLDIVNQYNPSVTYTFYGWEHSGLGAMNVTRALAMSSDIFFYTVAGGYGNFVGLGIDKLANYYQRFGLGSRTGVDVPEETAGRVPTPDWKFKFAKEPWYTGDTYNVSVGQGDILVSPLQMAVAIAAVANGGTVYKPHYVKQITDGQGKVVQEIQPDALRRNIATPATLAVVRDGMRQAVTSGTACCLIEKQVPVHVAAKTGTAETDPERKGKPEAWFEAFAPYEDPQIVMVALVENAPGEGAEFAAPVVREALTWYFNNRPH